MKKYKEFGHIAMSIILANEFQQKVANRIEEYQKQDLEVEVQYQQTDLMFSAIVLGFSRE